MADLGEDVVEEARRGVVNSIRLLQSVGRFVAAHRATPHQSTAITGQLPQATPAVLGESAPAPDQDADRLRGLLDENFPGWEQEPAFWDSSNHPEHGVQQRWPQWQDGFRGVVAAVPENRVGDVFPDRASRDAFQASRENGFTVDQGGVDPAVYGDLGASLEAIDRADAALEAGEYTDPEGRHAGEGGPTVAELLARAQEQGGPAAESAQRIAEHYGPLLDRLDGAEGQNADLLRRLAGGDEQKPAGTGGPPVTGSGEREGGKHHRPGPGVQKEGR